MDTAWSTNLAFAQGSLLNLCAWKNLLDLICLLLLAPCFQNQPLMVFQKWQYNYIIYLRMVIIHHFFLFFFWCKPLAGYVCYLPFRCRYCKGNMTCQIEIVFLYNHQWELFFPKIKVFPQYVIRAKCLFPIPSEYFYTQCVYTRYVLTYSFNYLNLQLQ